MNKQYAVWKLIAESLEKNIPVMLLYVLESRGSSPGRQGFFMAVSATGEMEGSVGGGIMEYKFVEMAKKMLQAASRKQKAGFIRKQYHDKAAAKNRSGMICSGEQTIFLYPVQKKDAGHIQKLLTSLAQCKNGTLQLSPQGIRFSEKIPRCDYSFELKAEGRWMYQEKTGFKNELFIIGGGHCALALSRLMSGMDFYIRVYEDRKDVKTLLQNDAAHEKHIVADYAALAPFIPSGKNHYVVIMTFGYRTDEKALGALLHKRFKYLGLLGSRSKIARMFDNCRRQGIDEKWLKRVYSPIGISINSRTPEEIAVSIAAQIIQVKNAG